MATWILILIAGLYQFRLMLATEERRERSWLGIMYGVFLLATFSVLAVMIYQLPAAATAEQLFPYTIAAWSCVSLYALFGVFQWFTFDFLRKRQWLMYLFLFGTLIFLALLWFFATPATTMLVFDGFMNWLAMPLIVVGTGAALAVVYLFLVDFIAMYQHNKTSEGRITLGNWIGWFGGFLFHISLVLMALVLYLAPFTIVALGLAFVAILIMFLSPLIYPRTST